MQHRRRSLLNGFRARTALVVVALAFSVPVFGIASGQVYGTIFTAPVVEFGPCFFSLFSLPATQEEACLPWSRRESAGPAFHLPSGLVLAGGSDRKFHALSAKDGTKAYEVALPGSLVARPTLRGPRAYFGTDDGHVLRTDITSGRISWDVTVDAEVIEPVVASGDAVYVVTGLDSVYAFDESTGVSRWVHKRPLPRGITLRGQARPLATAVRTSDGFKDRVFVAHASGSLVSLDADTGAVVASVELGRAEAFNDVDADPVLQSGSLIAASHSGGVFALDPDSLAQRWHLVETGIVRLAAAGRHMVVGASAGNIVGIDANRGAVRWRFTFEKGAPTRIVVKGGRVHVASDRGAVFVLDMFTGEPLQYYGSGLGVAADLELVGDMMFVVSTAGELHALSNSFRGLVQQKAGAQKLPQP